jgi:hypothetical protein
LSHNILGGLHRHVICMEERDELSDIGGIGSDSRGASVFAGKGIEECCQSLFKCDGVHVRSCVCHVSPTFSYRPKSDKSRTSGKNGSDNIGLFSLYGISSVGCQGGE